MHFSLKFTIFFLLLLQLHGEGIVNGTYELNEADFDKLVKNGNEHNWFVMFHAPWCPHCKRLTPVFEEMAQNLSDLLSFGVVDCEKNQELKSRFSIMGFPTLLYFSNNKMYEYPEKIRDLKNMTDFALEGYLKYEGEEIPTEASKIKNFKKHMGLFFQKVYALLVMYPYYSGLFLLAAILFIVLTFYITDWIFNKLEEREMRKQEQLKKNK